MPSPLVAALAAPIRDMQAMVGPGWARDPVADPAVLLGRARDSLADVSAASRRTWDRTATNWSGAGANAAADFTASTIAGIEALADRADRLSSATGAASVAVERANARLSEILQRFEAQAAALEPYLDDPVVMQALTTEARRSLAEAAAVVEDLRAELDGHAGAMNATAPAPTSAPTSPAGMSSPAMPSMGSMGSGMGGASPLSSPGGSGSTLGDLPQLTKQDAPMSTPEAAAFGDGVAVQLPDGSTAMAPNALAASAVRHALTQLGVPYDWGGTTPGVGLDCSGLTQWAYSEAGLTLPRLAQEQDVGASVAAADLRPGDLAVWDGHVAMIVGNGTMVEAGDPVKLSPIRTENAGQGFQGFWRPTA